VIFIGGGWAYQQYHQHPEYLRLATEAKILWAICIAPSLISDSGVLEWKNVTGRDDELWTWTAYMTNNWAIVHDQPAITDGDVITANGPQSARIFAQRLIEHLK
jgi:putative intracellular protease/amidase